MEEKVFIDRRSIRRYAEKEVDSAVLNEVLEAARWAPSWANSQCWELIVVKSQKTKKMLAEILSPKNPATLAVEKAPLVLIVCGKKATSGFYHGKALTKFGDWMLYDLGIVTQNICLAAHQQGLGTVIVGAFDHDQAGEILALPEGFETVALLPMGYPDHQPPPPKRKALEEFVHQELFGGKRE